MKSIGKEGATFAIRPLVLARYLCLMLGLLGVLTSIPLAVSLFSGNHTTTWTYSWIMGVLLILGTYGVKSQKNIKVPIQRNESLALVALVFITASFLQSIPIMSYGIPFIDAWFEAVSGVTTTGLSTLGSIETRPTAFLFSRSWMQWIGGLGVVVLALALIFQPGIAAQQLGFDSNEMEDVVGGTRSHAKRILQAYLLLTLTIILSLLIVGSSLIDSVAHAMSAISTGGFANYDKSLGEVSILERSIIMGGCLAGAISFHLYYRRQFYNWEKIFGDSQFLFLIGIIFFLAVLLFLSMTFSNILPPISRAEHALWMSISAQTTAGFATIPPAEMGQTSLGILSASMLIGGGLGSTSGGIKILRLMILMRVFQIYLRKLSSSSNASIPERFMEAPLIARDLQGVIAVFASYVVTLLISWFIFLQYGYDPLKALFEVSSALGTAGLTAGLVGPDMEPALKIVLAINMLIGRVEALAVIVLLTPSNWLGKRRKVR